MFQFGLYSLIVVEEELMNVEESPLRMGEKTGQKRWGQKGVVGWGSKKMGRQLP